MSAINIRLGKAVKNQLFINICMSVVSVFTRCFRLNGSGFFELVIQYGKEQVVLPYTINIRALGKMSFLTKAEFFEQAHGSLILGMRTGNNSIKIIFLHLSSIAKIEISSLSTKTFPKSFFIC